MLLLSLKSSSINYTRCNPTRHIRQFSGDNCRPEVDSDVISGVVIDQTDANVLVNFVILDHTVHEIYEPLTL